MTAMANQAYDAIAKAGVPVGSYQEVAIGFPQAFTALESKQIDIALLIERT